MYGRARVDASDHSLAYAKSKISENEWAFVPHLDLCSHAPNGNDRFLQTLLTT